MINRTVESRVRTGLTNLLANEARSAAMRSLLIRLREFLSAEDFSLFIESCRNHTFGDDETMLAKIGGDSEAMQLFDNWLTIHEQQNDVNNPANRPTSYF